MQGYSKAVLGPSYWFIIMANYRPLCYSMIGPVWGNSYRSIIMTMYRPLCKAIIAKNGAFITVHYNV
jgi:hypothetical protein